jgi:archaellum component FlaG (FlaF/FlaG flagellin family)
MNLPRFFFTITLVVLLILLTGTALYAQSLWVSGITTPGDANGIYIKQSGTLYGYSYWKHQTQNYFIYNHVYSGDSKNYWNIDVDFDDADAYFFCLSAAASPVGLAWTSLSGTGSANVIVYAVAPAIQIIGNGVTIANAASTPMYGNYTMFGSVDVSSGTATRTFTINNFGAGTLTLTGSSPYVTISGTNAGDFTVTAIPSNSIASSGSTTFQVTFNPSAVGNRNATISIANDDAAKNPYTFNIQGYGFTPGNLTVTGITTPSTANGNYIYQGVLFNFRYWKHESANYYLYNDEYSSSRYWNIDNNTDDAASYFFSKDHSEDPSPANVVAWDTAGGLGGRGTPIIMEAVAAPNIALLGNSITISGGDVTPSLTDFTDFGSADVSTGTVNRVFKIKNRGGAALNLTGTSPYIAISGTNASEFTVTSIPSSSIAGGDSTTFQITFNPSAAGIRSASISIASNDADENPFNFSIQGYGFNPKNLIVSGITTPAAANGNYIHQGVIFNYEYWKHQTLGYYIYNDDYTGSRYWNIDNNTDDTTSYFFSKDHSADFSPVNVLAWDTAGTHLGAIGIPHIIEAAPAAQASTVLLTSNTPGTQIDLSWSSGNGTKRVVFMREGTGAITNPANNTTYTASADWNSKGTQLGSSGYYCVYNGAGNSIFVTNTAPSSQYIVQVFEYNNSTGDEQYNTVTATGNPNNQTTLPVELASFTVLSSNKNVTLNWKTATEINNYGFEIERRAVKSELQTVNSWQKLGFVQGAGTSNSLNEYSFTDASVSSGTYAYRLKQIDNAGIYTYSSETEVTVSVPKVFALNQNYPNPFNPTTTISFTLADDGFTTLKIYNVLGREIATLVKAYLHAGVLYQETLNASKLSSGIYFYKLENGKQMQVKKLLLMK